MNLSKRKIEKFMPLKEQIEEKIKKTLLPSYLEVINESAKHKGHAGDNGTGESHFKLKIASSAFEGLSRLARQRLVYEVLREELQHIHALSLEIRTIEKGEA